MKNKLNTILSMLIGLLFINCETDLKEPPIEIVETEYDESVLIVNGISGLAGDDEVFLYANGSKLTDSPIDYASTSGKYIDVQKGEITFELQISNKEVASIIQTIELGKLYSIYLAGTKESPEILIKEDIISHPNIEFPHSMSFANLSNAHEQGVEMEIFIRGYDNLLEMGFHTATGTYGVLENYAQIKGFPAVLKYKDIIRSKNFAAHALLLPFPYRFIIAGTNKSDFTQIPVPKSTGDYFVGQTMEDLLIGKMTHVAKYGDNEHITYVIAGNEANGDQVSFAYNNTELYNNK